MKKIDCKECNTAKEMSIATEFDIFKDVFINKNIIKHKIKRIQSENHKLGTYEIDKISLSCFDDKRYVLDGGFVYFYKDSFTSYKEIKKDCNKEDCDKKDCNN